MDYDSQIERVAGLMERDGLSPDEQDPARFEKYRRYATDLWDGRRGGSSSYARRCCT